MGLTQHKHAAVIKPYYDALISGEIDAGHYELQYKYEHRIWQQTMRPLWAVDNVYRLIKTDRHPDNLPKFVEVTIKLPFEIAQPLQQGAELEITRMNEVPALMQAQLNNKVKNENTQAH